MGANENKDTVLLIIQRELLRKKFKIEKSR